jgi:transposase
MSNLNFVWRLKAKKLLLTSLSQCSSLKMPRFSHDERNQALGMWRCNRSMTQIARAMNCHTSTISRMIQRLEETGTVKDRPRPGQPRKTSHADDRSLTMRMLRNRRVTAKRLRQDLLQDRGVRVSTDTVRRRLRAAGVRAYRPYRGIVLTPGHRRARLAWARRHQRLTQLQWNKVMVTDESRILLQRIDGRLRIWRRRGERYADACTVETDRFGGGGSLMVWGGISGSHRTALVIVEGNLNGMRYRDEILRGHVIPFLQQHPEVTTFQHDNARPHTARICTQYLEENHVNIMQWPAKSPDLSPIENLWGRLKDRVGQLDNPPTTILELARVLQREWEAIPQADIRKLFNGMRRRCTKCITAQGGHIAY